MHNIDTVVILNAQDIVRAFAIFGIYLFGVVTGIVISALVK